jgi:hypothetical protein
VGPPGVRVGVGDGEAVDSPVVCVEVGEFEVDDGVNVGPGVTGVSETTISTNQGSFASRPIPKSDPVAFWNIQ